MSKLDTIECEFCNSAAEYQCDESGCWNSICENHRHDHDGDDLCPDCHETYQSIRLEKEEIRSDGNGS